MFTATVINFLLFMLTTGTQVGGFIVFIRKALILDIDYPLSARRELLHNALWKVSKLNNWARNIPVSLKLSLSNPGSIHARWRYYSATSLSFGGPGPSTYIDTG